MYLVINFLTCWKWNNFDRFSTTSPYLVMNLPTCDHSCHTVRKSLCECRLQGEQSSKLRCAQCTCDWLRITMCANLKRSNTFRSCTLHTKDHKMRSCQMMLSNCSGKCSKLANYITITDNGQSLHHSEIDQKKFVACNLPPDGRSSSERGQQVAGSNPPSKNNAERQLAIELLWPKPTDFVTGPAFEAFEERHDSATFSETEVAWKSGASLHARVKHVGHFQDRTCLLKKWTRKTASQF